MLALTTPPSAGYFEYSYPTFDDKPQQIHVHFITPDQQRAFVTFPRHRFSKTAQFIPVSWFDTVNLVQLEGHSPLMHFLESMLPHLVNPNKPKHAPVDYQFAPVKAPRVGLKLAA
ncbi:hypothetical protein [Spirosoma aerophilum]